uniref:Coatomer subunit zeta n=1 Tax=Esox lucius TaxID=8010 RepID=A0A3P8YXS3_ESOLU
MSALIYFEPTLYTVKAVLILDNDGEDSTQRYLIIMTVKEQKAFEKNIFSKIPREISLLEGLTVISKSNIDLLCYCQLPECGADGCSDLGGVLLAAGVSPSHSVH